jgi:protein-L-isoaspartate(D-aspartate) O-methyltransferase
MPSADVSRLLRRAVVALLLVVATASPAACQTKSAYERARQKMVDEVLIAAGVKDERVVKAMLATPRHEFVATSLRPKAYLDIALPIGEQQTISSPFIVGYMTQSLDPQPTDKVLEIGTGSGYQAAVLSPLVKDVYSIEIVEPLGKKAAATLKRLGYTNIQTKVGDGYLGWPEHAPFDKIIVTCSPEKVPQPLAEQLAEGGLMVIPVGERYSQTLYLLRKKDGKLKSEALLPTLFVPMTGKAEASREVLPDAANPRVVNGSFEEKALSGGAQPGWYYEKLVTWENDANAPDGEHYITFKNTEPGLSAHLLQGFSIDGRKVKEIEVSAEVKNQECKQGNDDDEAPGIILTFFDEQRRQIQGVFGIGPLLGTKDWHTKLATFRVPAEAREGILRIGLFGATGSISFDKVQMKKVAK